MHALDNQARDGGDVLIGAAARRRRRRQVLLTAAGAVMLLGAIGLYAALERGGSMRPDTRPVKLRCTACQHVFIQQMRGRTAPPATCERCKAKAAHELWRCRDCGLEFLPPAGENTVRCPACGKTDVGSAAVR